MKGWILMFMPERAYHEYRITSVMLQAKPMMNSAELEWSTESQLINATTNTLLAIWSNVECQGALTAPISECTTCEYTVQCPVQCTTCEYTVQCPVQCTTCEYTV